MAKTVGERLRALRGERTRAQVAQDTGVLETALANYENDYRVPRDEVKIRLAQYYGLTVGELFFDEHPTTSSAGAADN